MNVNYIMLPMFAAIMVGCIGTAQAENFTVEMTENGFSINELQINDGDSVTFINTHYVTDINVEPHAISDPFAVPYTEHSYYIIDDSTPERVYNFAGCSEEIDYVFHDRFFTVYPLFIICGGEQTVEIVEVVPEVVEPTPVVIEEPVIETVVEVVETNVSADTELQEKTMELTLSLEREGILANKVVALEDDVSVLEHQMTALSSQVQSLKSEKNQLKLQISSNNSVLESENNALQATIKVVTEERDYFEKQWVNWKAIAMEQLRVMVNVLGIGK